MDVSPVIGGSGNGGAPATMSYLHEILGYEVLATLGYGARSTIYAVQDSSNHLYALKRVVKQSASDQRFLDQAILEHEVASRFDHPQLRRSYKLIKQRNFIRTSEIFVLMEMVDGQTLEQHQPETMSETINLCIEACKGLEAMHGGGYVHADIKPNNIIATDRHSVKLIDFGQSCPIGTTKQRIQGTPDYIAPEQVLRRPILPQTDIFNLGASMYWLLTRKHVPTLIPRGEPGLSLRSFERCKPPAALNPAVPPALSTLVLQCIEPEIEQRPGSISLVRERLELSLDQLHRQNSSRGRRPGPSSRSSG